MGNCRLYTLRRLSEQHLKALEDLASFLTEHRFRLGFSGFYTFHFDLMANRRVKGSLRNLNNSTAEVKTECCFGS